MSKCDPQYGYGFSYQKFQDILSNDKDFCMKIFEISLKNLSIELQAGKLQEENMLDIFDISKEHL